MTPFTESLRYEYDLNPHSIVVDCGGYEGRWTAGMNERYGCLIHILEPVPRFHSAIAGRFANNLNIFVHLCGIAGTPRREQFRIKGDMTGAHADQGEPVEVELIGVEEMVKYFGPRDVDVLKLNIEGGEFEVVEKLIETGLINRVCNLQVQWHDVAPNAQARYDALQAALAKTHALTFDHGWVWQSWRRAE